MNLAERRVVSEFQEGPFPGLKARIEEAAGFAVPLDVHWDTLAVPGESRLYAESWPLVYFEPLIDGLKSICRDAAGREALKSSVKQIVVQNVKGCVYGDCWASFDKGVLTLDHDPITNINDSSQRAAGLVAVLEASL